MSCSTGLRGQPLLFNTTLRRWRLQRHLFIRRTWIPWAWDWVWDIWSRLRNGYRRQLNCLYPAQQDTINLAVNCISVGNSVYMLLFSSWHFRKDTVDLTVNYICSSISAKYLKLNLKFSGITRRTGQMTYIVSCGVSDPRFPRGSANPRERCQPIIWQGENACQWLHENERIWIERGALVPSTPIPWIRHCL